MTGEEYTAFLRARKPEVYIQNSSGVPVKWIVTRAYTNGVSAKHHVDIEEKNYSYDDTGFFPIDDNGNWEKNAATLKHLHALRDRIKALEQTQKNG